MPADFDEPVFDEEFVRNAAFTEPSARERARPQRRAGRWRGVRRLRARIGLRARRLRRERREPSHRRAVAQVIGGVLVLLAISVALWWWQSGSRRGGDETPVGPATVTVSPTEPSLPASEIPRVAVPIEPYAPVPVG